MEIYLTTDSTTLSYWLNWRVLICAIWVLMPMVMASYMIWKYEHVDHPDAEERRTPQQGVAFSYDDDAWRPCLNGLHPLWLLAFRIIAFFLLLGTLIVDVIVHGAAILYYYTQWTLILVTIYFGFGSLLSVYGCYRHHKMATELNIHNVATDAEQGLYVPLTYSKTAYEVRVGKGWNHQEEKSNLLAIFNHIFQVIFQMSAGAVMLTDCVYWFIIFPFLTIKDYDMNYLTVLTHTLNAILLLGDIALNCLRFPWFRISYFILWTGVYVIVQWIVHACVSIWWPYPFLDLSGSFAVTWVVPPIQA